MRYTYIYIIYVFYEACEAHKWGHVSSSLCKFQMQNWLLKYRVKLKHKVYPYSTLIRKLLLLLFSMLQAFMSLNATYEYRLQNRRQLSIQLFMWLFQLDCMRAMMITSIATSILINQINGRTKNSSSLKKGGKETS